MKETFGSNAIFNLTNNCLSSLIFAQAHCQASNHILINIEFTTKTAKHASTIIFFFF